MEIDINDKRVLDYQKSQELVVKVSKLIADTESIYMSFLGICI